MANARSIREGWLTSKKIDSLGNDSAENFLIRLCLKADKNGIYHAEPEILRSALYPLQVSRRRLADVTRYRAQCVEAGLLRLWIAADGRPYVQILKFRQKTPLEKPVHPLPPDALADEPTLEAPPTAPPVGPHAPDESEIKGKEGKGGHTLNDDQWIAELAKAHPGIDMLREFAACQKKYPQTGRRFFEQGWLPNVEPGIALSGSEDDGPIPEPVGFARWAEETYGKLPSKPWLQMRREHQVHFRRMMGLHP